MAAIINPMDPITTTPGPTPVVGSPNTLKDARKAFPMMYKSSAVKRKQSSAIQYLESREKRKKTKEGPVRAATPPDRHTGANHSPKVTLPTGRCPFCNVGLKKFLLNETVCFFMCPNTNLCRFPLDQNSMADYFRPVDFQFISNGPTLDKSNISAFGSVVDPPTRLALSEVRSRCLGDSNLTMDEDIPPPPQTIADSPHVLTESPQTIAEPPSETRTIVGSPSTIAGSPSTIAGSPRTIVRSPRTIAGSPRTIIRSPMPLAGTPGTLAGSPRTLAGSPKTLDGSPKTVAGTPETMTQSPHTTAESPQTIAENQQTITGSSPFQSLGSPDTKFSVHQWKQSVQPPLSADRPARFGFLQNAATQSSSVTTFNTRSRYIESHQTMIKSPQTMVKSPQAMISPQKSPHATTAPQTMIKSPRTMIESPDKILKTPQEYLPASVRFEPKSGLYTSLISKKCNLEGEIDLTLSEAPHHGSISKRTRKHTSIDVVDQSSAHKNDTPNVCSDHDSTNGTDLAHELEVLLGS